MTKNVEESLLKIGSVEVEEGEGNVDWKSLLEFGGREEEEESRKKFERGKKKLPKIVVNQVFIEFVDGFG